MPISGIRLTMAKTNTEYAGQNADGKAMVTFYRLITAVLSLFLPLYLQLRARRGKEEPSRLGERMGKASLPRPGGEVFWLHAASVGECISAMVLARAIISTMDEENRDATILMTSGTITSAQTIAIRCQEFGLEGRLIHQYVPLDNLTWVKRFLDHWQPALMVVVEGDLWPNMLIETHARGVPIAMASAQISPSSLRFWQGLGLGLARGVFSMFDRILTVDAMHAERFRQLPVRDGVVDVGGSMKIAAPPLAERPEIEGAISEGASGRMVVALLSSHDAEESLFIDAMLRLEEGRFLAVIAPRHPDRGQAIQRMIEAKGKSAGLYSRGEWPQQRQPFWIVDRIGEMGGIIRATDMIVLGGGFAPMGGHNPMEAAALGKGIISGSNVFKNQVAFDLLEQHGGVVYADTVAELADQITTLAASPSQSDQLDNGAFNASRALANQAVSTAQQILAFDRGKNPNKKQGKGS